MSLLLSEPRATNLHPVISMANRYPKAAASVVLAKEAIPDR